MKKIIVFLSLALLLPALVTPAMAENRAGALTLSPFIGGYTFDCFQCLDTVWYYGVRAGYNFTENLGLEGMFGYAPTQTDACGYKGRDIDVFRYGLDILYHFMPEGKFVPFVAAGLGGVRIDDPSGINDRDHIMFDYGLGFKLFVAESVALRADVRHDLFYENSEFNNNLEYTVGLTFLFGGKKKVAAAPVRAPYVAPAPAPAPRAPAPPPPVAAKPEPKVVLIELGDMHFGFDQSSLTPQGKEILAENVRILKANPDLNILVAGYASASGTEEYNQALSERRATAVRDALIAGGIAPERLTKIGYGQTRPATFEPYPADLESKAAKSNMRVLFTIIVD
jgi:OOP family OmpA-OmpF porin